MVILQAIRQGNLALALELIQKASLAELNATDLEGQTALHIAVQKNYLPIIKPLLEKGVNINAIAHDASYTYMTPLHYAALIGNLRASKLLLQFKADVHLENGQFHNAATIAHQHGFAEVARLIEKSTYQFVRYQWPYGKTQKHLVDSLKNSLLKVQIDPTRPWKSPNSNVIDFSAYRLKKTRSN